MDEPRMVKAAKLNDAGVFIGMDEILESELTSNHLPQITDCDLPVDAYRWVVDESKPEGGTFVRLPKPSAERQLKEPNTMQAIYKGFVAIKASGLALPNETENWMAWFSTTIDAKDKE